MRLLFFSLLSIRTTGSLLSSLPPTLRCAALLDDFLTIGCYYVSNRCNWETTAMNSQEDLDTNYHSYMLRMWRTRDGNGKQVWCASLQEPGSYHTESFGDADDL